MRVFWLVVLVFLVVPANWISAETQGIAARIEAGSADAAEVLRFISLEPSLDGYYDAILAIADDATDSLSDEIYRRLGMRSYLIGDIEAAAAYLESGDADAWLLAAHARLLIGQHEYARRLLQQVLSTSNQPDIRQQAITILGLSRIADDDDLAVVSLFEPFRSNPEQILIPELLYVLIRYELTLDADARYDPGEYYHVLQERFPKHPVTRLARNFLRGGSGNADGRVVSMPSPEAFLFSATKAGPDIISEESPGEPAFDAADDVDQTVESSRARGIQVGSFGLRENAEHMQTDLEDAGFPIVIEEQQRDDRLYYSVVIPLGEAVHAQLQEHFNSTDPEQIYLEIKSAGYDGFRLY